MSATTTATVPARPCTGVMGWLAGHKWEPAGYVNLGDFIDGDGTHRDMWRPTQRRCQRCGCRETVAVLTREGE